jgi:hypothetical protein
MQMARNIKKSRKQTPPIHKSRTHPNQAIGSQTLRLPITTVDETTDSLCSSFQIRPSDAVCALLWQIMDLGKRLIVMAELPMTDTFLLPTRFAASLIRGRSKGSLVHRTPMYFPVYNYSVTSTHLSEGCYLVPSFKAI